MDENVKWIIKVTVIPVIVSAGLAIWFFIFQERPYKGAVNLDETHRILIDSIIRTISHLDRSHALGNIIGFFSISIVSLSLCTARFYFVNLLTVFILNLLFLSLYLQTGVGFSIVLYGVCLVFLLLFLKFQYIVAVNENFRITNTGNVLLVVGCVVILILYLVGLLGDFMIVLDIISMDNQSYMDPFISDKEIYTERSSQAHLVGSVIGMLSFAFWSVVFQRLDKLNMFDLFR